MLKSVVMDFGISPEKMVHCLGWSHNNDPCEDFPEKTADLPGIFGSNDNGSA